MNRTVLFCSFLTVLHSLVNCVSIAFYRETHENVNATSDPSWGHRERKRVPFHILKEILVSAQKRHIWLSAFALFFLI